MTSAAADTKLDAHVLKIAGVVVLGAIMAILDITVVSVALRTFMDAFDTSYATAGWTMTAYTLALATVIPLSGWASDRFGTKRLYMAAIILFAAGSALCATAGSIGQLIAFRAIQGLGGGMLMPIGMTIMTRAAGPERVGRVMAVLGVPMLIGPIAGPILSGWLIQIASWHWVFLINVPIAVGALAYSYLVLPKDQPSTSQPFDLIGMVLLSPGLALLLFGVSSIPEVGTIASTRVLLTVIAGTVLIALFVRHAFRPEHPLIDLRLFQDKQLTLSVIGMFLFGISFFGAMLLLPSYFQQVRGEDTLHAGLLLAPQGIGAMLTMPIAGRLADSLPIRRIVIPGVVVCCIGVGWLTQVGAHTSYVSVLGALFVLGLGMGATMMPLFTAGLQTLTGPTIARGSTLLNIVQQVASSCGAAIMTVLLTDQLKGVTSPDGAADAFGFTFAVAAVLIAVVLIPAALLPRRKTHTPPPPIQGAGEPSAPKVTA
jgi:EmrB/QacA subfamily drug resistance transporter